MNGMSVIEIIRRVRRLRNIPKTPKAVLLVVATYSDAKGTSWPSQDEIAADLDMAARTIRIALEWLEGEGFLTREARHRANGWRSSDRIVLNLVRLKEDRQAASAGDAATAGIPTTGTPEPANRNPTTEEVSQDSGLTTFEGPREGPKPNPPREIPPAPGRRPAPADADAAPKGALSLQAVLCPDDFRPEGRHYAAAEAAGFDRTFVRERADAIRLWSRANAHQPKAWKTDWSAAFDGMLKTALREAAERRQREAARTRAPQRRASTHGALALLVDMYGADHDARDDRHSRPDLGPVIDDAGDGRLRGPVPQPPGGLAGRLRSEALAGFLSTER